MMALRTKYLTTRIQILKFEINRTFKRMTLYLISTCKTIIAFRLLAYISIRLTFRGKFSYRSFSLLVKSMANIVNKALYSSRFQDLYSPSSYFQFYDTLSILLSDILFAPSASLLFYINMKNRRHIGLY